MWISTLQGTKAERPRSYVISNMLDDYDGEEPRKSGAQVVVDNNLADLSMVLTSIVFRVM